LRYVADVVDCAHIRLLVQPLPFGCFSEVCQFRWYSTSLNRTFLRLAQWRPNFLRTWFTFGVFFGLVAMLLSVMLLTLMVFNTLTRETVENQVLTPIMPGVNLPASQISYYMLTLLVCGILHEFGHAIAAIREQVRVNGFGLFLMLIYPGAYVDLSSEHLQIISPMRQLRIYCAGVWHNFIIVLIGILVLFMYPWFLMPFYSTGYGVVITQVSENTAVSGPRGLAIRDPVTSVGGCPVTSVKDWNYCLTMSIREPSLGNCLPVSMISELDTSSKKKLDTGICMFASTSHYRSSNLQVPKRLLRPKHGNVMRLPLDGQFICQGFIELTLRSTIPDKEVRDAIFSLSVLFGTVLLALNVIMAMWMLF
ncbi:MBTP2-like protein, partial [Mya arenaria]